jgi:hypothetical protein
LGLSQIWTSVGSLHGNTIFQTHSHIPHKWQSNWDRMGEAAERSRGQRRLRNQQASAAILSLDPWAFPFALSFSHWENLSGPHRLVWDRLPPEVIMKSNQTILRCTWVSCVNDA